MGAWIRRVMALASVTGNAGRLRGQPPAWLVGILGDGDGEADGAAACHRTPRCDGWSRRDAFRTEGERAGAAGGVGEDLVVDHRGAASRGCTQHADPGRSTRGECPAAT